MVEGGLQPQSSLALKVLFCFSSTLRPFLGGVSKSLCLVNVTVRVGIGFVADEAILYWVISGKLYINCRRKEFISVF